jgi:hypothetical protein
MHHTRAVHRPQEETDDEPQEYSLSDLATCSGEASTDLTGRCIHISGCHAEVLSDGARFCLPHSAMVRAAYNRYKLAGAAMVTLPSENDLLTEDVAELDRAAGLLRKCYTASRDTIYWRDQFTNKHVAPAYRDFGHATYVSRAHGYLAEAERLLAIVFQRRVATLISQKDPPPVYDEVKELSDEPSTVISPRKTVPEVPEIDPYCLEQLVALDLERFTESVRRERLLVDEALEFVEQAAISVRAEVIARLTLQVTDHGAFIPDAIVLCHSNLVIRFVFLTTIRGLALKMKAVPGAAGVVAAIEEIYPDAMYQRYKTTPAADLERLYNDVLDSITTRCYVQPLLQSTDMGLEAAVFLKKLVMSQTFHADVVRFIIREVFTAAQCIVFRVLTKKQRLRETVEITRVKAVENARLTVAHFDASPWGGEIANALKNYKAMVAARQSVYPDVGLDTNKKYTLRLAQQPDPISTEVYTTG